MGSTLAESGIGARTGLNVIAVQNGDEILANPSATTKLAAESELVILGDPEQRRAFRDCFA